MARDDYQIVESKPIGSGSFGTVFVARRVKDGAPVAFKLVLHSGEWGAERIEAERKGAILQQRFAEAHGMVPDVYDYGADGDDFYIAMELIDGPSLDGLLRNGPLAAEEAAGHALWLCGFLEKAHAFSGVVDGKPYRIVHTDLKPAHLIISSTGERKVLDFGIAKALEESRELGTDIGRTIAYASPERLVSDQVNPHADFWSLGVMLYEMVCGRRPYPHFDGPRFRRDLEHAITSNAPRAPFPASCPEPLRAIVNKLLALQVEHRYPTAAAIAGDLERLLRGESPDALAIYDTPATTPLVRSVDAVLPTVPRMIPRTDPVPAHPDTAVPATTPLPPVPPVPSNETAMTPADSRATLRRVLGIMTVLSIVLVMATEGVAWPFAERFRDTIPTIDERTVTERRSAYAAVDRWGLLDVALRMRVNAPLRNALVSVGDRVIADYRREAPSMGRSEWRQAHEALTWATDLSWRSRPLLSKQLTARGHVKRFEAQTATRGSLPALLSQEAVAIFREAADADPRSFDPYLGMARIQVYLLADVDAAAGSIAEAEKRGYRAGRREAAMLGDGYQSRAKAGQKRAALLTGEQRERELNSARADFQRCVAFFDPIVAFGNAAANLEVCKAQAERIDRQLQAGVGES